jgi:poly(3-hydroxybutyrate) depolymerase
VVLAACNPDDLLLPNGPGRDGRLSARPSSDGQVNTPGAVSLGLNPDRDAFLYVPPGLPVGPAPLVMHLHGDPGSGSGAVQFWRGLADDLGFVLLAPSSQGKPWDAIVTWYGHDVLFIDRALAATFQRCDIDPGRIGISGFSAGASYALALGRTNGDLFRRVVSIAPAYLLDVPTKGRPGIYVIHGTGDPIAPIEFTSDDYVPELRAAGYEVTYRTFDGGHVIPPDLAAEAFSWMVGLD